MGKTENKTASNGKKPKLLSGYARFGGLAFQLLAVLGFGIWFGYWLDNRYQFQVPIFTILGTLLSLTASILYLIKQTK